MRRFLVMLVTVGAALTAGSTHAEVFGLLNGRSANLSTMPDLSVEGGFVTGDFGRGTYDHIGFRVNYRIMPGLVLYADLGQSESGYRYTFGSSSADGTAFGLGAYYQLRDLIPNFDASIKGSFHKVGGDLDGDAISIELLISPVEPLTEAGLNWYANAGIHRFGGDIVSGTDPGIGGGITMPLGPGELIAGADFIDDISFGIGFRYAIK